MGIDWGEVLGGALASGLAGWSEGAISEAKAEREAERARGLKEMEMEWEKEKLNIQKESSKELNQQQIDANAKAAEAAAKRSETKEAKDAAQKEKEFLAEQAYRDKSLDYQAQSAGKAASEVQLMEYLDDKGLLGSYLDQKTGANKGEDIQAKAYSSYMGKSTEGGEEPLTYSAFKNKYYGSGETGGADSASSSLLDPATIAQKARERAAAAKNKSTISDTMMSGH